MDGTTDFESPIEGWFETGFLGLFTSESEKQITRMRLYGKSLADVRLDVKVDGETDVRPKYSKIILGGLTGPTGKFFGADKDIKQTFYGNFFKFGIHFTGKAELYGIEAEIVPEREELLRR